MTEDPADSPTRQRERSATRHGSRHSPAPSYVASAGSPLSIDPLQYGRFAISSGRERVSQLTIPVRTGRAWRVPAGHVCRFSTLEGPQVLDLNIWSAHDPRERFWAARTRQFYGTHLTVGHRLWSTLPALRPLATIIADTINYGRDDDGAGCHDLLGTRCDPYVNELLSGSAYDYHCHSNLTRAILEFGLTEYDVHDVINLFQVTGLMPGDHRYFMKPSPAHPGDYFELFAETDLLMAASTCPAGDLALPMWGPDAGGTPNCNPIGVEVFKVPADRLGEWKPSVRASYAGMSGSRHGLEHPVDPHPSLTEAIRVNAVASDPHVHSEEKSR